MTRPDRSTVQMVAVVVVVVGAILGIVLPVPYVVLSPGPVIDVLGKNDGKPLITIQGAPTYPTSGRLDLTTVSERGGPHGRVSLTQVFGQALDPTVAVVPSVLLYPPDETPEQVEQQNTEEMMQSQDSAAIAALRHLGLPVTLTVSVASIQPGSPAQGSLEVGDRILRVNGVAVSTGAEVRAEIRKYPPGTTLRFDIERKGTPMQVSVTTAKAPDDPTKSVVGFTPEDGYTSPVKVSIQLEDVGGPSAGLMFSLGIVDELTPQQENGGAHVAGTGTIDADGVVGPIGGIRQKMAGAREAGATVFLVPAGNCAEALKQVPDGLRLVKVTSLDDAVSGLAAAVAGKPAPVCTPG